MASSDDTRCQWYHDHNYPAVIFGNYVTTLMYLVFGGFGHAICLFAFYKQRKKETAYTYQLFVVISETIEIITYTFYITTLFWGAGAEGVGGAEWFQSCYPCMLYAARVATPLLSMFITSSLYFSISLVADRLFALRKPFLYKTIRHHRHQMIAFLSCYLIGISTSIFDTFRLYVTEKRGNATGATYELTVNEQFIESSLGYGLAQFRNVVRILGVVVLVTCNISLMISYHSHTKKINHITSKSTDQEINRRSNERTLVLLAVLDSILNTASMTMLIAYYMTVYMIPTFFTCEGVLYTALLDGFVQLMDIGDFYLALLVSKQFRQMVFDLPIFLRFKKTPATTANNVSSQVDNSARTRHC